MNASRKKKTEHIDGERKSKSVKCVKGFVTPPLACSRSCDVNNLFEHIQRACQNTTQPLLISDMAATSLMGEAGTGSKKNRLQASEAKEESITRAWDTRARWIFIIFRSVKNVSSPKINAEKFIIFPSSFSHRKSEKKTVEALHRLFFYFLCNLKILKKFFWIFSFISDFTADTLCVWEWVLA